MKDQISLLRAATKNLPLIAVCIGIIFIQNLTAEDISEGISKDLPESPLAQQSDAPYSSPLSKSRSGDANNPASSLPAPRPNIIFILSDDQGWADIGYQGKDIITPNLDQLAASGVKLTQHYVHPTCSPTRVGLLFGRFPSRFGVLTPIRSENHLPRDIATLPKLLRQSGYTTHLSGKWHMGPTLEYGPKHYGFDTTYGYLHGQVDPYTHRYKLGDVTWHRNGQFVEEEGHATDLITDEAVRVVLW